MADYENAVYWIARADRTCDTPGGAPWDDAMRTVSSAVTVCLLADVFGRTTQEVAEDVLREQGLCTLKKGAGKWLR